MKTKVRNLLIVFFMALAMLFGVFAFMPRTAKADEPKQEITLVETWGELLNAVNADKTNIKLANNIKDIVPDDELPSKHRLAFDGGMEYVLDLNGCTLEVINHANEYYTDNFSMISVSNNSSLTVKDGDMVFDNWYAKSRQSKGLICVEDDSKLLATHVNMANKYAGPVVLATSRAKVVIEGGQYTVQSGFALYLKNQASLTLDNDVYVSTFVGDSTPTMSAGSGYGALYSESDGELVINHAFFKTGVQVSPSQIGAFSTATHEVTVNGKVLTEDIFNGTNYEAKQQNKEYYWYTWTQSALERTEDASFCNTVRVISYEKKYAVDVVNGTAMVDGVPVTEASYGQTVEIVADTPEEGMEFVFWTTSGVELADYYSTTTSFTMLPAPVSISAYYGKESVQSVSLTVEVPQIGQKVSEAKVTAENGAFLNAVEWFEDSVLMDETDIFVPGKTYSILALVYPPEGSKFADSLTAIVNGENINVSASSAYAYVNYTVVTFEANSFSVVYNTSTAQLGIGGFIELDTALMASQSQTFKTAHEAGTVAYQWYKNGEAIEGATDVAYYFTAEDVDSIFYVTVTIGEEIGWGYKVGVANYLYQIYLNAGEVVAGGRAPQMSSATPGIAIAADSLYITEGYGMPAMDIQKSVLIPGQSYVLFGKLQTFGEANLTYGASVHVNGELMPEKLDGLSQFAYEFTVPAADYAVYYKANGEIGLGVTLTVDIEKMCEESGTFKHAYEAANPTYQTVFYQWYKNGEAIKGATKSSYTVKTADRDSMIHCTVTLLDGKYGIGEQFAFSNMITVLNVNIPTPKNGDTRIEKTAISVDGVDVVGLMWWPAETGATMQGSDTYVEGTVYEFYLQVQAKDTFLLDFNGDMTIAYIYGSEAIVGGSVPNEGKASYLGEVTAIHAHVYSDQVWAHDKDGHWKVCTISGCPDPNGDYEAYVFHHGGNATCHTAGICSVCGAEYYEEHDFSAGNYVYRDEMTCVSTCGYEGCDATSDWNYHTGGVSDCQHKAICEICHHEYGDFAACAGGKATCESKAICATCGNAYGELAAHVDQDSNGKCDVCGDSLTGEEPDEPEQPDVPENPEQPEKSDKDSGGLGVGAIVGIAVGGSVVVGVGVFALIWFAIKKKTWADFLKIFKKK